VAAGEDEPEPVVGHVVGLPGCEEGGFAEQVPFPGPSAETIDRVVSRGGGDPAAGVGWQPAVRPPAQSDREGLLHRVLGQVDVAEGADQGGHRPAGLLAEDPADGGLVDGRYAHVPG
jgi:hypothetical protein